MRRARVISCLASSTQQMYSLRARGVMSFHASSAVGLAISASRSSPGSLWTTPPATRGLLIRPRYRPCKSRPRRYRSILASWPLFRRGASEQSPKRAAHGSGVSDRDLPLRTIPRARTRRAAVRRRGTGRGLGWDIQPATTARCGAVGQTGGSSPRLPSSTRAVRSTPVKARGPTRSGSLDAAGRSRRSTSPMSPPSAEPREAAERVGVTVEWICSDALQTPFPGSLVRSRVDAIPRAAQGRGRGGGADVARPVRLGGLLFAVYHDLDDEHREHMKSRGFDPADYVGADDLAGLLGDDFTVEVHAVAPRIEPAARVPQHIADIVPTRPPSLTGRGRSASVRRTRRSGAPRRVISARRHRWSGERITGDLAVS